jgi:glycosyltransferase involved in cell wall biosynthesis
MRARNPLNHFYWTARQRVEFVSAFTKRYGKRFALFGKWWKGNPSWQGPISYGSQHEAYRSSAVVVGGVPNACHDYYTSDRVFIAAASGVPLVDYWVPGVDRLLKPERDWWLGRDIKEMIQKCDMLLEKSVPERQTLAEATRQRILSAHTQYHRCVEMINIVRTLRDARAEGKPVPSPKLPFLLDSSGGGTVPDSVVAWRG